MENRRRSEKINNHSSDSNAYKQYRQRQQRELWEKANNGWTPNHSDLEMSVPRGRLLGGGYIEQVNAYNNKERHMLRFAINNPEELEKDVVKYGPHWQLLQYYNKAKALENEGKGNVNVDLMPPYEQRHLKAAKKVMTNVTRDNKEEAQESYSRIMEMGNKSGYECHDVLNRMKNEGGDITKQMVEAVQASYDAEGSQAC